MSQNRRPQDRDEFRRDMLQARLHPNYQMRAYRFTIREKAQT